MGEKTAFQNFSAFAKTPKGIVLIVMSCVVVIGAAAGGVMMMGGGGGGTDPSSGASSGNSTDEDKGGVDGNGESLILATDDSSSGSSSSTGSTSLGDLINAVSSDEKDTKIHCPGYIKKLNVECSGPERGTCSPAGKCQCLPGFTGLHCQEKICTTMVKDLVCSGKGTCVQRKLDSTIMVYLTAMCVCEHGYRGAACHLKTCPGANGGELDAVNECHVEENRGKCDDSSGKCVCQQGFKLPDCKFKEAPLSIMGGKNGILVECGGRGKVKYTDDDPTKPYCECFDGFQGPSCNQKKCSGSSATELVPELPCFGNGQCDFGVEKPDDSTAYHEGICKCKYGFNPEVNCQNCLAKHYEDDCSKIECLPAATIGGQPQSKGENEKGKCDATTGVWTCKLPWYDVSSGCNKKQCPGHPNECSGRAECDKSTGVCGECDPGYYGDACQIKKCPELKPADAPADDPFNPARQCGGPGRGACIEGTCVCHYNFATANCGQCSTKSYGENCGSDYIECGVWNDLPCGGKGTCDRITGQCTCDEGSRRTASSACQKIPCLAPGCGDAQSGSCNELTGRCECINRHFGDHCEKIHCVTDCNKDLSIPSKTENKCNEAEGKCVCGPLWTGSGCEEEHCLNYNILGGKEDCLARGTCTGSALAKACTCHSSFWGATCEFTTCPGKTQSVPTSPSHFCTGNGVCEQSGCTDLGNGLSKCSSATCRCSATHEGAACDLLVCPSPGGDVTNQCSHKAGKGTCNNSNGQCECVGPYYGSDCSLKRCPLSADISGAQTECGGSARGTCNSANGECTCKDGFYGSACEHIVCPKHKDVECNNVIACDKVTGSCNCPSTHEGQACERKFCDPKDCNGRGTCNFDNGICQCSSAYYGNGCQHTYCPKDSKGVECTKEEQGTCNPADGKCTCTPNFYGDACQFARPEVVVDLQVINTNSYPVGYDCMEMGDECCIVYVTDSRCKTKSPCNFDWNAGNTEHNSASPISVCIKKEIFRPGIPVYLTGFKLYPGSCPSGFSKNTPSSSSNIHLNTGADSASAFTSTPEKIWFCTSWSNGGGSKNTAIGDISYHYLDKKEGMLGGLFDSNANREAKKHSNYKSDKRVNANQGSWAYDRKIYPAYIWYDVTDFQGATFPHKELTAKNT
eukprot:Nk52_evm17s967 gene=Nk52_evmTU17s967